MPSVYIHHPVARSLLSLVSVLDFEISAEKKRQTIRCDYLEGLEFASRQLKMELDFQCHIQNK